MDKVLPFEKSYWIIPGKLLAGQYPASKQMLDSLLDIGIKVFVNLTSEDETTKEGTPFFKYHKHFSESETTMFRRAIEDGSTPTLQLMKEILTRIDQSIRDNKPVYFHCWGGAGRTGTVTGSYLMHSGMTNKDNVLDMINYLKRTSPYKDRPSPGKKAQQDFILNF